MKGGAALGCGWVEKKGLRLRLGLRLRGMGKGSVVERRCGEGLDPGEGSAVHYA
jgi:hypothetical protein